MRLSHILEIPSISIKILGISNQKFEILGISSEIPSILETCNFD